MKFWCFLDLFSMLNPPFGAKPTSLYDTSWCLWSRYQDANGLGAMNVRPDQHGQGQKARRETWRDFVIWAVWRKPKAARLGWWYLMIKNGTIHDYDIWLLYLLYMFITIHERVPFSTSKGRQFGYFFFTSQGGKGFGGKAAPGGKAPGGKAAHGGKAHGGKAPPTQGTGQFGGHAHANKNTLICWSKNSQFLGTKISTTHWNSFKKTVGWWLWAGGTTEYSGEYRVILLDSWFSWDALPMSGYAPPQYAASKAGWHRSAVPWVLLISRSWLICAKNGNLMNLMVNMTINNEFFSGFRDFFWHLHIPRAVYPSDLFSSSLRHREWATVEAMRTDTQRCR